MEIYLMAMTKSLSKAVNYICSNDNVTRECALCNITRQALRVMASDRELKKAVKVAFYISARKGSDSRPRWQSQAIIDRMSELS